MRRRKNLFVSIDLQAEEVRLLIVQKGVTGLKTICSETYSRRDLSLVGQKLQQYCPKEVILILPQERVIVRDLTVPPVEINRVRSMLFFELAGILPYSMEQVELDFLLLQRSKKSYELKVFIIPEHLNREVEYLRAAGIMVDRVIPRGLAVTGYCKEKGIISRPAKLPYNLGHLLVYPDYKQYFCRYHSGEIDPAEIKQLFSEEGIEPFRWDIMDLSGADADLLGAIYFAVRHNKFNLIHLPERGSSVNMTKIGIAVTLIAILAVNCGTFYLNYTMKAAELAAYQTQLQVVKPQAERAKKMKNEFTALKERYEKLKMASSKDKDYLVWLSELHTLLAKDTEVNILVFEGDQLKEMHGRAPLATSVSERLAGSPYFKAPEFTSPITPKEDENGQIYEEFSISAQLINPDRKGGGGR